MFANFQQEPDLNFDLRGIVPTNPARLIRWGAVILGIVLLFVVLTILRGIYTDWLWFGELGFRGVYVKVLITRVALFVMGGLAFGAIAGVSLYFANRVSEGPEELPLPQATRDILRGLIRWGVVAATVLLGVIFGVIAASEWELFLRFWNGVSFGTSDPVYNKDVSFYVFNLPLYGFLQGWVLGATIVVLLATVGLYFVKYSFRGVGFVITSGLKIHVSVLAAVIMFALASGHWLDRWGLLLSDRGAVFGVAYVDENALKPALLIMTIIAFASGVLILVNAYMRGIRLLIGGVALWGVMAVLLTIVWPNTMQRLTVNPNEFSRERPFIDRNIEFTRRGFGLENIVEQLYAAERDLSAELISQNLQTIDNIRLWDHGPLSDVYKQIQLIRPYYDFKDADVDRYVVDGEYRQVMLAAREVAREKLDPDSQTWINEKLRYTHGFGMAMSPVTEFTPEGRPEFFAKDIPRDGVIVVRGVDGSATDEPETVVTNPRIYYGEKTDSYVIVNTNTDELDYQAEGGELKSIKYYGEGGVPLSSFVRRLAYAWQFGDINVLISGEITGGSRIQYRREIQHRISKVAPFLRLDHDPYIVASGGGLFWIQDAYTVSNNYPYSDPNVDVAGKSFNYVRNSVKVVVDAFNGSLAFYVVDNNDPMIRTYQEIFPELFLPLEDVDQSLRAHFRFPQDLFGFQADKYLRYHMLDPQDFYNLEDIWSIPSEKFGQSGELVPVAPYYAIMKLPGGDREEFVLLIPYTRNDPPIMAGWLAARNDGENYGQLVAFNFPKERQVDSPQQIEARIDNDSDISEWFTLRCQEGSDCIRGNLLVIPMASRDPITGEETLGLLYAEPVYLQAEGIEFPELKRVILATGEKVVMEDSVDAAVCSLTGFCRDGTEAAPGDAQVSAPPPAPTAPDDQMKVEIDSVTEALEALKEGLTTLEEALQRLTELTEEQ